MYHRLRRLRKTLGLNQHDFAKQLGLSQSTLAMMEVGKRNVGERHIKVICSHFKVNERWLRDGEGGMFSASPHEAEFMSIFQDLQPALQQYLLTTARALCAAQGKLLDQSSKNAGTEAAP